MSDEPKLIDAGNPVVMHWAVDNPHTLAFGYDWTPPAPDKIAEVAAAHIHALNEILEPGAAIVPTRRDSSLPLRLAAHNLRQAIWVEVEHELVEACALKVMTLSVGTVPTEPEVEWALQMALGVLWRRGPDDVPQTYYDATMQLADALGMGGRHAMAAAVYEAAVDAADWLAESAALCGAKAAAEAGSALVAAGEFARGHAMLEKALEMLEIGMRDGDQSAFVLARAQFQGKLAKATQGTNAGIEVLQQAIQEVRDLHDVSDRGKRVLSKLLVQFARRTIHTDRHSSATAYAREAIELERELSGTDEPPTALHLLLAHRAYRAALGDPSEYEAMDASLRELRDEGAPVTPPPRPLRDREALDAHLKDVLIEDGVPLAAHLGHENAAAVLQLEEPLHRFQAAADEEKGKFAGFAEEFFLDMLNADAQIVRWRARELGMQDAPDRWRPGQAVPADALRRSVEGQGPSVAREHLVEFYTCVSALGHLARLVCAAEGSFGGEPIYVRGLPRREVEVLRNWVKQGECEERHYIALHRPSAHAEPPQGKRDGVPPQYVVDILCEWVLNGTSPGQPGAPNASEATYDSLPPDSHLDFSIATIRSARNPVLPQYLWVATAFAWLVGAARHSQPDVRRCGMPSPWGGLTAYIRDESIDDYPRCGAFYMTDDGAHTCGRPICQQNQTRMNNLPVEEPDLAAALARRLQRHD